MPRHNCHVVADHVTVGSVRVLHNCVLCVDVRFVIPLEFFLSTLIKTEERKKEDFNSLNITT